MESSWFPKLLQAKIDVQCICTPLIPSMPGTWHMVQLIVKVPDMSYVVLSVVTFRYLVYMHLCTDANSQVCQYVSTSR